MKKLELIQIAHIFGLDILIIVGQLSLCIFCAEMFFHGQREQQWLMHCANNSHTNLGLHVYL